MKDVKTVIEFGTSKIAAAASSPREKCGFEVLGYVSKPYAGIKNGNWVEPELVGNCLSETVSELEHQAGFRIKNVDLSLPATFSDLHVEVVSMGINEVVSAAELDNLFSIAAQFPKERDYTIVNQFSAWYMLEDGEVFIDAYGKKTSSISAGIVSVLANKYLIEDLEILTKNAGLNVNCVICEQLAEALALIPEAKRDSMALLIDIGYYVTSVSLVYGDSVLKTICIDAGGGNISDDIAYNLKTDNQTAERLKRQYSFGLDENIDIAYLFAKSSEGNLVKYPYDILKNIIDNRTLSIVRKIMRLVSRFEKAVGKELSLYMTGGGLCYMPGINSFFQNVCRRVPVQCKASNTKLAEFSQHSMYAAMEYSLNSSDDNTFFEEETRQTNGFLSKISRSLFK